MIATFGNTLSILIKAFLEDTLSKGSCTACAVGNICAAALGTRPVKGKPLAWENGVETKWDHLFLTGSDEQSKYWLSDNPYLISRLQEGFAQIAPTGYTVEQLARIEFAFEAAAQSYDEEAEFAGLMAVVDVLADIHNIDLATALAAKSLFVKA